ncbi:MAG TPA: hypothetical protein VF481_14950 [Novosphingobium sp.]
MQRLSVITGLTLLLVGCAASSDDESASKGLEEFVSRQPIGGDADAWIEMKNSMGQWERTGLIFGYYGDYEECQNAIAGMKQVNNAREYRCTPANAKKP